MFPEWNKLIKFLNAHIRLLSYRFFLQAQSLWQPCFTEVPRSDFPTVQTYFLSLCYDLEILTGLQASLSICVVTACDQRTCVTALVILSHGDQTPYFLG